jgi:pimeloyl-ACP methyl ester carboxylesterase
VPARLLWVDNDAWFPREKARELAAALPDAELRFIPESGHFSPEDNHSPFAAEILEFERELGRGHTVAG